MQVFHRPQRWAKRMTNAEGKLIGQNALDAVAVAEERHPGGTLLVVQTTLVLRDTAGELRVLNVAKERER